MIITTTQSVEGYIITDYLDVLHSVESDSFSYDLKSIKEKAEKLGADAIIDIKPVVLQEGYSGLQGNYQTKWKILLTGTAVKLEKCSKR